MLGRAYSAPVLKALYLLMCRLIFVLLFTLICVSACSEEIEDPRLPYVEYTRDQVNAIEVLANTRKGDQKSCFDKSLEDYLVKVEEHCKVTGYAKKISGGCSHVIHYTKKSPAVKWVMLEKCGIKTKI